MILAISDLHGHIDGLINAIDTAKSLCKHITHIVLLGDYTDNGPHVPQLLSTLIEICNANNNIHPIMGNHDLINIYNLELGSHFNVDTSIERFQDEWNGHFNSFDVEDYTPFQYHVMYNNNNYIKPHKQNVPEDHKKFLVNLPLYYTIGNYIFVHAGFTSDDINEQKKFLDERNFGTLPFPHVPTQLNNTELCYISNQSPFIVVSGHRKFSNNTDLISDKRVVLHSGTCLGHKLHCVLLPENAQYVNKKDIIQFEVETESCL